MVFLGLTSASELAYMSYAYAKVRDHDLYQKMTGIVRGSNLLGKCLSSTFAQIAVSYVHIEYGLLVYISLTGINIFILLIYFTRTLGKHRKAMIERPSTFTSRDF